MTKRLLFLICVLTSGQLIAQYRNEVQIGVKPISGDRKFASGVSAAYFHGLTALDAIGITAAYQATAIDAGYDGYGDRSSLYQVNLMYKTRMPFKKTDFHWDVSAGLGAARSATHYMSGLSIITCDVGFTEEELIKRSLPYTTQTYHFGVAIANSLRFPIGKRWEAGVELMANYYYNNKYDYDRLNLLLIPTAQVGFSF